MPPKGMNVVKIMENNGSMGGDTKHLITIKDCGMLEAQI